MLVPHGGSHPRQISIHFSLIILLTITWTGITFWGSYLSAQHIDYWRTRISNHAMKLKIRYLVAQIDQSREYLDEVKTVDAQMRDLLKNQNAISVITTEKQEDVAHDGTGGPTLADMNDLTRIVQSVGPDISWNYLFNRVGLMKVEAEDRITSFNEINTWIERQRRLFHATPRGWPCRGWMTSRYGSRASPFDGNAEFHPGIDISGPTGTPVCATADGVVRLAAWTSGYGNLVLLQHDFGFSTRYAHNSRILVRAGDTVKRGQTIALMGTTGKSSGTHCHYEVWKHNERKNPASYLKEEVKLEKFSLANKRQSH